MRLPGEDAEAGGRTELKRLKEEVTGEPGPEEGRQWGWQVHVFPRDQKESMGDVGFRGAVSCGLTIGRLCFLSKRGAEATC